MEKDDSEIDKTTAYIDFAKSAERTAIEFARVAEIAAKKFAEFAESAPDIAQSAENAAQKFIVAAQAAVSLSSEVALSVSMAESHIRDLQRTEIFTRILSVLSMLMFFYLLWKLLGKLHAAFFSIGSGSTEDLRSVPTPTSNSRTQASASGQPTRSPSISLDSNSIELTDNTNFDRTPYLTPRPIPKTTSNFKWLKIATSKPTLPSSSHPTPPSTPNPTLPSNCNLAPFATSNPKISTTSNSTRSHTTQQTPEHNPDTRHETTPRVSQSVPNSSFSIPSPSHCVPTNSPIFGQEIDPHGPLFASIREWMLRKIAPRRTSDRFTYTSFSVHKIEIVTNADLWIAHMQLCRHYRENRGTDNVHILFHGTPHVASILQNGFDLNRSSKWNLFGPGIYLSEHSSVSNEYALGSAGCTVHQDPSCPRCPRHVLCCQTALGRVQQRSHPDRALRGPPAGCNSVRLQDRPARPPVYTVFDRNQVYPLHVITYSLVQ